MSKELSEMTLEELWHLFPIVLRKHSEKYKDWYESEKNYLLEIIDEKAILRINHIGSTAVKGIIAKPTIDILMEISEECDTKKLKEVLNRNKWILMKSSEPPNFCQIYNKGYTKEGFSEKVYHLHVRYYGDWDELYFRDYLIDNEKVASKYEELKIKLYDKYKYDRDAYTDAKTNFVEQYSQIAKKLYIDLYK